jgi:hypothetical protein
MVSVSDARKKGKSAVAGLTYGDDTSSDPERLHQAYVIIC